MLTRLRWIWDRVKKRLWFRVALFALLGIVSALGAVLAAPLVPSDVSARIGADAVDKILGIMASSMLTVAIFSLSTMVSAYGAAASAATPRATSLMQSDTGAHNALGTFIGAFLFSLVGIIALSTGLYGSGGRLLLLTVTLVVVAIVVATFIGWIDRLSRLGRMSETIDRVATAAAEAVAAHAVSPAMGASPARPVPDAAVGVASQACGYVQFIDMDALAKLSRDGGGEIDVLVLPGSFLGRDDELARVTGFPEDVSAEVRHAFIIGERRSFDQDPRFGLIVLSEIASRALSAATNDPGTAIEVLATVARILTAPVPEGAAAEPALAVFAPAIPEEALLEDFFVPVARDCAGSLEVALRIQRTLKVIAGNPRFAASARALAADCAGRALATIRHGLDRERLVEAAAWAA